MSWHFLQEQEEASWEGTCLDGAPDVLLSLIPTPERCCLQDKETEFCLGSPSGMTCPPLTASPGEDTSMSSAVAFHAKTSAQQEAEQGSQGQDQACGQRWPGSWVRWCPDTSLWKTRQCSLLEGSESFLGTWPRWGTMRGGECWAHTTSEHLTSATESGSWLPTPSVSTHWSNRSLSPGASVRLTLHGMAKKIGGHLCPIFVETVMGWPIGWTDLEPLGMDKYQQWQRLHGVCFQKG